MDGQEVVEEHLQKSEVGRVTEGGASLGEGLETHTLISQRRHARKHART